MINAFVSANIYEEDIQHNEESLRRAKLDMRAGSTSEHERGATYGLELLY